MFPGIHQAAFENGGAGKYFRQDKLRYPYLGAMELSPFRPDALRPFWYHMNGDLTDKASPQGMALLSLPQDFRDDWGIVASGNYVPLPDWYAQDGRAYFPRAGAVPGVIQQDMIRNIAGLNANQSNHDLSISHTGPFGTGTIVTTNSFGATYASSNIRLERPDFDASRCVPTGPENRPVNRSLTPAIFLAC
jgi:hypothetical protein